MLPRVCLFKILHFSFSEYSKECQNALWTEKNRFPQHFNVEFLTQHRMNAFMKPSVETEFESVGRRIDEIMRLPDTSSDSKLSIVFEHLEQFLRVANPKDSTFSIYLTILKKLSGYYNESMMKYQSEESFLAQYPSFQHHSPDSLRLLRNTANWMYM